MTRRTLIVKGYLLIVVKEHHRLTIN